MGQQVHKLHQEIDSVQQLVDHKKNTTDKLKAYKEAFQYFIRRNPDIAQEFAQKGYEYAQKENAIKEQVGFSNNLGLTYVIQRNYSKALDVFNSGLDIAKEPALLEHYLFLKHRIASLWLKQGHKRQAAQLLDSIIRIAKNKELLQVQGMAVTELGKLERSSGNYEKSLALFKQNLEIAKQLRNKEQIAYTYLQIAIDYDKTGEQEKAIEINRKGIHLAKETKNSVRLLNFYNNIAVNFRNLKQYDSAFYYQEKVLSKHKKMNNPFLIARSYMNMGTTYSFQKEYKHALLYYDSAYQLIKDKKGNVLFGTVTQNMGALYQDMKEYKKSNQFNYKALSFAQKRKQVNEYYNIYENIYQSYKGLQKWDSALFYHEKMGQIKDSLFNSKKLTNTEAVKRAIENAENQQNIDQLNYNNKRNSIISISAIGALSSFILFLYLWGINLKRKKKIAEQSQKLEEQKVLTLIQEQESRAVNAMISGQEKERQKIAEELHDSLGSSLATLKLHTENLLINPKITKAAKLNIINKIDEIIDDTYKKVRNISHIKSTSTVEQQGLIRALEKLSSQINTDNSVQVHIDVFGFEKITKSDLKIFIYNSIQELLTNAIKHAKADNIDIQITQHERELNILIEDNGKGIKNPDKIFEKGMGLYHIKKKVELLKGHFNIDSTLNKGTTINISIPV